MVPDAGVELTQPHLDEVKQVLDVVQPGVRLSDYTVENLIGFGGSSVVFRGISGDGEHRVAVKFLVSPPTKDRQEVLQLFNLQAAMLAEVDDESIVKIFEFGEYHGFCYLVMDLFVGPEDDPVNLKDYANWFGGVIEPRELVDLYKLLLPAVGKIHAHKIVHGNLKPQNVLLQCVTVHGEHWEARTSISDFGISRILGNDYVMLSVRKSLRRAAAGVALEPIPLPQDTLALLNTYDYLSPEQRRGEGAGCGSDIFALGLMFMELLCGDKHPGFDMPSSMVEGIGPDWDAFILKATSQERLKRFRDIESMLDALNGLKCR